MDYDEPLELNGFRVRRGQIFSADIVVTHGSRGYLTDYRRPSMRFLRKMSLQCVDQGCLSRALRADDVDVRRHACMMKLEMDGLWVEESKLQAEWDVVFMGQSDIVALV